LSNVGLEELIATTPEEYLAIAAEIARDVPRWTAVRSMLRSRMEDSPLMDAARFTHDVENAYRFMWSRWCVQR
jgi:protein O-GlcNAc transferase